MLMSDEKLKRIFANNLLKQLNIHGKQPVDLVNDLHIPFSTVSNWINGLKFPRMGTVEMLASYFGIEKSDLYEEKSNVKLDPDMSFIIKAYSEFNEDDKKEILALIRLKYEKYKAKENTVIA